MNTLMKSMIATLLVLQVCVTAAQDATDESIGVDTTESWQSPVSAEPVRIATAATGKAPTADQAAEPISGAFGIALGKRFNASMVARVIDEQPQSYRGADAVELIGSLIRFEPRQPDSRFQNYAVKTTSDGLIYAIQGDYQFNLEEQKANKDKKRSTKFRKTCKNAVKALAREFEGRYGKPRGSDMSGEWYAFRQFSETEDKSLRLYANRCRSGIYSVVYTDQALLGIQAKPPKKPQKQRKEQEQDQEQMPETEQQP